ncbi:MAG TPA: hypothetical protein VFE79_06025 [Paraburkholderia sp.]|jgi:hypothetical protein|nr:hypothetical protein [Paraburkholderia sp.]
MARLVGGMARAVQVALPMPYPGVYGKLASQLDWEYPEVAAGCGAGAVARALVKMRSQCAFDRPAEGVVGDPSTIRPGAIFVFQLPLMIEAFARVSGWEQLYHVWELIVMLCKFLWGLLRLLGGG